MLAIRGCIGLPSAHPLGIAAAARHPAVVEPIERLGASLRRLRAQLEDLETRPDVLHKGLRLRALRAPTSIS